MASFNNRFLSSPVLQKKSLVFWEHLHIKRPYWRIVFNIRQPKLTPTLFFLALYLVVICKWIYFSFFFTYFSEVSGSIGLVGYHQCQGGNTVDTDTRTLKIVILCPEWDVTYNLPPKPYWRFKLNAQFKNHILNPFFITKRSS